jgi:hypothetical protein
MSRANTLSDSLQTGLEALQSKTVAWQPKLCLGESILNALLYSLFLVRAKTVHGGKTRSSWCKVVKRSF